MISLFIIIGINPFVGQVQDTPTKVSHSHGFPIERTMCYHIPEFGPVFLEQCPVPQEFPEAPGKDADFILRSVSYRARCWF